MKNILKKSVLFIALALMLFAVNNQTANAQSKRLNSSPPAFRTFFAKFRAAVEKNNRKGVAAMTLFPFRYGFDIGDEGTMSKAQYIKRFKEIFGESPAEFLSEKNPAFSRGDGGSYVVSTEDAADLIFVKQGKIFRFRAYIVSP